MMQLKKNETWAASDDGDPLWLWGLIDPEFDAAEYQTAQNVEDTFVYTSPATPNVVGNSRDNFDNVSTCEEKYSKRLRLISETDMDNYRKALKGQMRVYQKA